MHISLRSSIPKCTVLFSLGSFHLFSYFFLIFELYNNDTPLIIFCICFVHRLFLRFIQISLFSHAWLHDITFALIFFLDKHLSVPDMFVPVCLHGIFYAMHPRVELWIKCVNVNLDQIVANHCPPAVCTSLDRQLFQCIVSLGSFADILALLMWAFLPSIITNEINPFFLMF